MYFGVFELGGFVKEKPKVSAGTDLRSESDKRRM